MSIDYNKSIVGGRLTSAPTPIGDKGCRFSVAVNRTYRDKDGERQEDTTYVDCVAWAALSELIMQRCDTGSSVLVEGRIEVRRVEKDGEVKRYTNVVCSDVRFVDPPRERRDSFRTDVEPQVRRENPKVRGLDLPEGTNQATVDALNILLSNK